MKMKRTIALILIVHLLGLVAASTPSVAAPLTMKGTASVTVSDQPIVGDKVTVDEVVYNGSGWIVIHADNGGAPGTILGYSPVGDGTNKDVVVQIAEDGRTDTLYAMLHTDAGTVGTFEFPNGDDVPVKEGGAVITPSFSVTGDVDPSVEVEDQQIVNDQVTVKKVVSPGPGWIVIHADAEGSPGAILGKTAVSHGTNTDVKVTLAAEGRTDIMYAMLHADNGTRGTFDFPNGDDKPVTVNGSIVTPSFNILSENDAPGFSLIAGFAGISIAALVFRRKSKK